MGSRWILVGSVSGFLGIAFGAFGAHALAAKLSERALAIYHTGAQYQMYHALALLTLGVWVNSVSSTSMTSSATSAGSIAAIAGWCFTLGTIVFSGSLYALALTDIRILGAITPIGGTLFLAGWISVAIAAVKS